MQPTCPGSSPNWCPITKRCETDCQAKMNAMEFSTDETGYQSLIPNKYSCDSSPYYCSNEETCYGAADLTCPASFCKIKFKLILILG